LRLEGGNVILHAKLGGITWRENARGEARMRVLVVDDNALIRKMIRATLEGEGLQCIEAPDLASGLASVRRDAPDVCFLDQNLPDGDGLSLLRMVQTGGRPVATRFFLLTGSDEPGIATRAKALGARGVLFKPVAPALLLMKVRET
jgi:two-component system, chemotaxis family, chemotaxis protein CheY